MNYSIFLFSNLFFNFLISLNYSNTQNIGLATKSFRFFPFENHEKKKRNDFVANPIYMIIHKIRKFWNFTN